MLQAENLLKLQERFERVLTQGGDDSGLPVRETEEFSRMMRLDVYQYAYFARILESLEEDFPKTRRIIGSDRFEEMARAFLEVYPSRFHSLAEVSAALPKFLKDQSPWSATAHLSEIADWEWVKTLSFLVEDPHPSNLSELSKVAPEEFSKIRFSLHPSAFLRHYRFNVKGSSFIEEKPNWVVVLSPGHKTMTKRLTEASFRVLSCIQDGRSLGEIEAECPKGDFHKNFQTWTTWGLIHSIRTAGWLLTSVT